MGKYDPNQLSLDMEFTGNIKSVARQMRDYLTPQTAAYLQHNDIGACYVIVMGIKKGMADSGMSIETMVDRVNAYFCRTTKGVETDPPKCLRPVTVAMMRNYLSSPSKYRLPAYYLFGLCHVLGTLEPIRSIAASMGGEVISKEDAMILHFYKLRRVAKQAAQLEKEMEKRLMGSGMGVGQG